MGDQNNILEGEAWESDEEDTSFPSFVKNTMVEDALPSSTIEIAPPSGSIVISGEAEETDEESEIMISSSPRTPYSTFGHPHSSMLSGMPYPSRSLSPSVASDGKEDKQRPRFQSPIHKKLWERNFALRCGIVEEKLDVYDFNTARLQSSVPNLIRAQNSSQDTLWLLKSAGEDFKRLNQLSKSLFTGCKLPDFIPGSLESRHVENLDNKSTA